MTFLVSQILTVNTNNLGVRMKCQLSGIYRIYHYFEWWSEVKFSRILKFAVDEGGFKLHVKLTLPTVFDIR